jgi:uncharacterized protein YigA (DUF484 family)
VTETAAQNATPKPQDQALKARILAEPRLVLDDPKVMRALLEAGSEGGRQVVDLRGALVGRLESRLTELERTHRDVVAAAYENLAGASQVHRVVLSALEQEDPASLAALLLEAAPQILAADVARLCVEVEDGAPGWAARLAEARADVVATPRGGVIAYLALDDTPERDGVWLRPCPPEAELLYGAESGLAKSEALMLLDLNGVRGLLAYACEDPDRFAPEHGVDLVSFMGGAVSRILARSARGA